MIELIDKELIGLFLKQEVSDFDKNVVQRTKFEKDMGLGGVIELNTKGYNYWVSLCKKTINAIKKQRNLRFVIIQSYGNAGLLMRELRLSLSKGKFDRDLIIRPNTDGDIKHLYIKEMEAE